MALVQSKQTTGNSAAAAASWDAATTAGNVLIAVVSSVPAISSAPGGWTLGQALSGFSPANVGIYYAVNAGSQSGSQSWGLASSGLWTVTLMEFSGYSTSATLDIATTGGTGTNHAAKRASTANVKSLVISGHAASEANLIQYVHVDGDGPLHGTALTPQFVSKTSPSNSHLQSTATYREVTTYVIPDEMVRETTAAATTSILITIKDAAGGQAGKGNSAGIGSIVQKATAGDTAGTTLTPTLPATATTGNVLVIAAHTLSLTNTTVTTPSGWILAGKAKGIRWDSPGAGTVESLWVFWKVSDGTETAVTVDFVETGRAKGAIIIELANATHSIDQFISHPTDLTSVYEDTFMPGANTGIATRESNDADEVWLAFIATSPSGFGNPADVEGGFTDQGGAGGIISGSNTTLGNLWSKFTAIKGYPRVIPTTGTISWQVGAIVCFGTAPTPPAGSDHWAWAEGSDANDSWQLVG